MLLIDHTAKKSSILQISTTPEQTLEFKTGLTERIIIGKFGNFESPNDPVAIVREGFDVSASEAVDSDGEEMAPKGGYSIKMVNTFELAQLLKRKGNKGRYLFVEKLVFCLQNDKCFMLKHFYDESAPQMIKLQNRHKNWQTPLDAAMFDPEDIWQTKISRFQIDSVSHRNLQ